MPRPAGWPYERAWHSFERLSQEEQAVLHRLLGRERPLRRARRSSPRRERAAIRERRRVLANLGVSDVRSLVRIVMELKL